MTSLSFPLGDVLSLTTGKVVGPGNLDGLRRVVAFLNAGDADAEVRDPALLVLADSSVRAVLQQHPDLDQYADICHALAADMQARAIPNGDRHAMMALWVAGVALERGSDTVTLVPMSDLAGA